MDYPVQLTRQLQQLLKSLRKSRQMTQAELARRLGVVQSRVADIERDPGAVSVEQLLQVLAILGGQMVVRDSGSDAKGQTSGAQLKGQGQATATGSATLTTGPRQETPPALGQKDRPPADEPRGQW